MAPSRTIEAEEDGSLLVCVVKGPA